MKHKNNSKGFTLIELLAVIVIMGILMMVAIPAMSKVIENSRKDTFIETAQTYTNAVNTLWKADSLYCGSEGKLPSTLGEGDYYILIDSDNPKYNGIIERGGNSSWGNKPVRGYVKVSVSFDSNGNRIEKYNVALTDEIHGIKEIGNGTINDLNRSNVLLNIKDSLKDFDKTKALTCVLEGKGTDKYIPPLGDQILLALGKDKSTIQEAAPETFAKIATKDEGIYKTKDDDGDSYYFRGAVTNNILRISNGSKEKGKEYDYYRIIRINGDKTIRMLYFGQDLKDEFDNRIALSKYNEDKNNKNYNNFINVKEIGDSSSIKIVLDSWFNNLTCKDKISFGKYCNDLSDEGNNGTYGAYERLVDNKMPSLKCPSKENNLNLKVGLITADEIAYAGGVFWEHNTYFYPYGGYGFWYWTMTPFRTSSICQVGNEGDLLSYTLYDEGTVRPVINLKSDLILKSGKGTENEPFEIK